MQEMLLEVIRVQSGVSINWNRLTQYHKPVGIYLACKPTKLPQVWLFMWTVIRDKLWGHFNETDMHAHKHLATQKIMRNHTYFMWKHTYFMENHTHFLQEATWTAGPLHLPTTSVCRGSEAQATGQPKPCTPVDVLLVCCIVVGFGVCICILHVKPPELPFVICTCHDITGKENITLRCTLCIYILLVIYILLQEEHTTHSPSSSPSSPPSPSLPLFLFPASSVPFFPPHLPLLSPLACLWSSLFPPYTEDSIQPASVMHLSQPCSPSVTRKEWGYYGGSTSHTCGHKQ